MRGGKSFSGRFRAGPHPLVVPLSTARKCHAPRAGPGEEPGLSLLPKARLAYAPRPFHLMSTPTIRPADKRAASKNNGASLHRKWSSEVVDGYERAASRAMLHAVGFTRDDFKKSQIGIASTWAQVTPCNIHIDKLARQVEAGVSAAGGKSVIFNTITISDGISMGTEGMK